MEHVSEAFTMLKPICIKVAQQPTKENINELRELICRAFQDFPLALQDLQGYILFPLELHLKNYLTRSETRRYIVSCIKEVVHHTCMNSLEKLLNVYTLLFLQIFDKEKAGLVADVSEELKCGVLDCTSELLRRASPQVALELYEKKHFPKLMQGIFMCVHMAHAERSRSVRLNAITCIMTIAQVNEPDSIGITFRKQVGDMLMFVLPGLLAGLMKAMTADDKQGHKVTMMSLRAWSRIITLVMEDRESAPVTNLANHLKLSLNQQLQKPQEVDLLALNMPFRDQSYTLNYLENQCRTLEWLQAAAKKLAPLTMNLTELQSHPHWLVRQELVFSCSLILTRCSQNLHLSVIPILEILIVLSEDEIERVAMKSKSVIDTFSAKCDSENFKLLEILEENLFCLVSKIPRIAHSKNDAEQLTSLRLLAGYLRLLGASKLPKVLSSASHLHRLITTLIHVVELDSTGVSLLDEYSLRDLTSSDTKLCSPWKQFKHFTDQNILEKVEEICVLLGQFADLTTLVDHLLDVFHNNPLYCKEVVLLLNEILSNTQISPHTVNAIKIVLDVYLEPSVWYVPLYANCDRTLANANVQSNLILACLLVEGIGKIAVALGRTFNQCLLRTLYVVLERAGSSYGLLAQAGTSATQQLAVACGHENVTQLVCCNVDYFTYHVTMKLRRVEQNPGVLDVLNVVMKHSTFDVLPCMRIIVNDVLLQSFDTFQDFNALAFLRVFHTFIISVRHWLESAPSVDTTEPNSADVNKNVHTLHNVREELLDFQRSKIRVHEFINTTENQNLPREQINSSKEMLDSESLDELNDCDRDNEAKKNIPGHIQMTVSILTKCLHFLPSKSKQHKLIVLETLQEGVHVLAHWENELLPVVHLIWSPLVGRLTDVSEPLLVSRSLGLLCALASTAKDFIQSRTLKQVLPPLLKFLTNAASDSKQKDFGSSYRYTQKYKLQHELLDRLGQLCVDLRLQNKELDDVLFAAIPYLSNLQPQPLQICCVKLFQTVAGLNADAVWLKICCLADPCAILLPSEQYIISGDNSSKKCQLNVEEVLKLFSCTDRGL